MKINLARSAGFCFGVQRALDIAFKTAGSGAKVYMLGNIVHNEDVIKEVQKAGIKKISKLSAGKNRVLLIRAHGASIETFEKAHLLGYKIVDATCPMVKEIHKIAKNAEEKGYKIIIIGDKKHDEVHGIIGQLKNPAVIIDSPEHIPFEKIKTAKKAAVLSQSTQNLEKVLKIVKILKAHIKELKFFNTICRPTRLKQEEIKTLPLENDSIIIIGSKTSANTRRLFEIAKALNPRTYWVQSKKELSPRWFKDAKTVGITAGASTPQWITQEVIEYIERLS
jgi:4-hydroxy-3-methylbut-2-enyl diphosphate reductase